MSNFYTSPNYRFRSQLSVTEKASIMKYAGLNKTRRFLIIIRPLKHEKFTRGDDMTLSLVSNSQQSTQPLHFITITLVLMLDPDHFHYKLQLLSSRWVSVRLAPLYWF